jgi:hypothetical protein
VKITHRNPAASWWHVPPSAEVDPAYQAEVDRATQAGEREFAARQARLARAEARLAAARREHGNAARKRAARLAALVELRRAELEDYRRLLVASPASAAHRGTKSFRPVPPTQAGL